MTPKTILLATDLSCRCDRALARAVSLAKEWNARLVVLHALETPAPVTNEPSWRGSIDPRSAARKRLLADLCGEIPSDLELIIERGEPAQLVLDTVARLGCELVMTGVARDELFGRSLLGSTVETLARRSNVPVLIVKSRACGSYADVVVASDFSECSRNALEAALEMVPAARVSLFHAYQVPFEGQIDDRMAVRESFGREALGKGRAFLAETSPLAASRVNVTCEYGALVPLLRDLIDARAVDLVVVGKRGHSKLAELLLGSVAQAVLSEVPCDVMVVPMRK
ncbi:MAG: universal stress protein [Labilithrix sp.]|nr:universal stress protein [Labilithrix sp.]